MTISTVDLEKDAETQRKAQAAQFSLTELVQIGEQLEKYKADAEKIEQQLKQLNEQVRMLETEVLPEGLKNLGIKDLTLASGAKITLVDVVSASITEENRPAAHNWLRENGHGDIIKNNVTVTFGKGEDEHAKIVVDKLIQARESGDVRFGDIEQKETVHTSTLKAFVRGLLAEGAKFPGELFKLYTGHTVKMTK
ncbi:MAG: hypothetical protein AB7U43_12975 [Desulfobacter sp.]